MTSRIPTAVLLLGAGLLVGPPAALSQTSTIPGSNPTQRVPDRDRDRDRDRNQDQTYQDGRALQEGQVPVYRITVVGRTTPAINYRHRGGATTIGFRGTPLLPEARGEAKVESKQGYIEVEVEFDELEPATQFGPEYLTYVMWAITPEGRATNLGEVLLNGSESKLNVTTELQAFGLVVTAEPYFAVSQPSDVVVLENVVRPGTRGNVEHVVARYDLLKRGSYVMNGQRVTAPEIDSDTPLELYEARNAVQLASFASADRYATETHARATRLLAQAEEAHEKDKSRRTIVMAAREAAQTAEDGRLIALQRQEEERVAAERRESARREAEAERRARLEEDRRRAAEEDRRASERERAAAEEAARRSAQAREEIERERAASETARLAAERAKVDADLAAQRLSDERAAAEAAARDSEARADQARLRAEQAEREKSDLRTRLQQQLNIILETRESARGLIVNMSDVLFDTARHTLRPGAREKLAKVAGVLLTYPGLTLEVEGHTDNVGSDDYNQGLSDRRAESVRAYLIQQGIPRDTIVSQGLGESSPVVSNDTSAGRQQNRRVELIVSGEAIGAEPTSSSLSLRRYPDWRARD